MLQTNYLPEHPEELFVMYRDSAEIHSVYLLSLCLHLKLPSVLIQPLFLYRFLMGVLANYVLCVFCLWRAVGPLIVQSHLIWVNKEVNAVACLSVLCCSGLYVGHTHLWTRRYITIDCFFPLLEWSLREEAQQYLCSLTRFLPKAPLCVLGRLLFWSVTGESLSSRNASQSVSRLIMGRFSKVPAWCAATNSLAQHSHYGSLEAGRQKEFESHCAISPCCFPAKETVFFSLQAINVRTWKWNWMCFRE